MSKAERQKIYDNEEYYLRRAYTMELKYPYLELIAKVLVANFKPKRALSIGCAKGYEVHALRRLEVEAYGVDISPYAINQSPKGTRKYLQVIDVETEELPFRDETLDMVTSLECLEHLKNLNHVIIEIARVLKPGGIIAINVPKLQPIITHLVRKDLILHPSYLSKASWIQAFETRGFTFLGNFIKQESKETQNKLKNLKKKHAYHTSPNLVIAKYLKRLGVLGRCLRVQLSLFFYQSEYLLFRKERCN